MRARAFSALLPLLAALLLLLPGPAGADDDMRWLPWVPLQRHGDGYNTAAWPSEGLRWIQENTPDLKGMKLTLVSGRTRCTYHVEFSNVKPWASARVERNGRSRSGGKTAFSPSPDDKSSLQSDWHDLGFSFFFGSIPDRLACRMGMLDLEREVAYFIIYDMERDSVRCAIMEL